MRNMWFFVCWRSPGGELGKWCLLFNILIPNNWIPVSCVFCLFDVSIISETIKNRKRNRKNSLSLDVFFEMLLATQNVWLIKFSRKEKILSQFSYVTCNFHQIISISSHSSSFKCQNMKNALLFKFSSQLSSLKQ